MNAPSLPPDPQRGHIHVPGSCTEGAVTTAPIMIAKLFLSRKQGIGYAAESS
jgi:hypothetical protein